MMTISEIAKILGISPRTVESHLANALGKLRQSEALPAFCQAVADYRKAIDYRESGLAHNDIDAEPEALSNREKCRLYRERRRENAID